MGRKRKDDGASVGPIIILTASRSGSTLLRLILDSHPDIAAPPESGFGSACGGLARIASVLFADQLKDDTGGNFASIIESLPQVAENIRNVVAVFYASYAELRGKVRWCDKSLDNFNYARLISLVFPDAKFICLYRHCMDVVASGIEVAPWGLSGFGFADYAIRHPGNSVAAIVNYWLSTVREVLDFEKEQPERCFRLRYEDLVSDPEPWISKLLSFVGAEQVPGITSSCFDAQHDGNGPGDQKVWLTSEVSSNSIGRGNRVPAQAIPSPLLEGLNKTLADLGYRLVDERWNASIGRLDPRVDMPTVAAAHDRQALAERDEVFDLITARLASAPLKPKVALRHQVHDQARHFHLVVEAGSHPVSEICWEVGLGQVACDHDSQIDGNGKRCAKVIGEASTWAGVLAGTANLAVETSAGRIRCVDVQASLQIPSELLLIAEVLRPRQLDSAMSGDAYS